MPEFQWQAPANPYVGTIADLMMRGQEAVAEAKIAAGNARAQAQAASGQIWGNTLSSIGQSVAAIPQQIQQQKAQQQEGQIRGLQLNEATGAAAAKAKYDTMMAGGLNPGEQGPKESYLTEDGMFDIPKINSALMQGGMAHLAPELTKPAEAINESMQKYKASSQQAADHHTLLLGDMADGVEKLMKAGMPIDQAIQFVAQPGIKQQVFKPEEIDSITQQLKSLPQDQQMARLATLKDAASKLDKGDTLTEGAIHVGRYGANESANPKPQQINEATIALQAAHGDPVLAMHMLKPGEQVKAGTQEDWVDRARRLAVIANDGKPLSDQQLQDVDTKAIQNFKEINTDPEMRAANLAQKNLAQVLAQLQAGQQPTREDAELIARQVLNHQMAPSQAMAMGGFGTAGAAFKRMIGTEIAKEEPGFSWEQAQADYDYSKTPSFQNTVRYIDSTLESMPRLLTNARALAQGQVQSINKMVADGKKQLNNVDLKKFTTDAIFVGDEIAKILQGGGTGSGTSDSKLKQAQEVFSTSDNPSTIAAALEEIQPLLGNRRRAVTKGTPYATPPNTQTTPPPNTLIPGLSIKRGSN